MVTGPKDAIAAIQKLDDTDLPGPGSRMVAGVLVNVCWNCSPSPLGEQQPVGDKGSRYRCPKCGRTIDDDPKAKDQHIYPATDVDATTAMYPEADAAVAAVATAKADVAKAPKDAKGVPVVDATTAKLAACTVTADPKPADGGKEVTIK